MEAMEETEEAAVMVEVVKVVERPLCLPNPLACGTDVAGVRKQMGLLVWMGRNAVTTSQ
jgi:hypothetical protein